MNSLKWVEVDIRVTKAKHRTQVILGFIRDFVQRHRGKFDQWHFLRERNPRTGRPEIWLRFQGKKHNIDKIKKDLHQKLSRLKQSI